MKPHWPIRFIGWACYFAALLGQPHFVTAETESESFRAILELAEIDPEALAQLGEGPEYSDDDWQLLLQVFSRLQQFRDPDPTAPYAADFTPTTSVEKEKRLGEIVRVGGVIVSVEKVSLPKKLADLCDWKVVYRCQLRFLVSAGYGSADVTILTTHVPRAWRSKKTFQEGVKLRGTVVQFSAENGQPLILTNHLAWYPQDGAPTGQLLLASHGMDVALLDEVRHKQPFVKPEISREGEAFYAALSALNQVSPEELFQQAKKNVAEVAAKWQAKLSALKNEHQKLEAEFAATTDNGARERLQQQTKQAKKKRGLAAAVLKQAKFGQSSVAPMFLQPEAEVGELFVFEGTARRAVRIAAEDRLSTNLDVKAYYELEVFTSDSQNLPIVCCVTRLPNGFPTGDEIREPVRLSGVFFKLWRYRSRKLAKQAGETTRQRQLYTPVVLSHMPTWLNQSVPRKNHWALWGGIAFLGALATLWISLAWLAGRDRRARAALQRTETIDI
ncbi:MAG: hypothetical protein GXP24_11525 [Planctomycetes bacterium]|nr:hypothetical protein [Planctomycetota bacterium]